MSSPAASPAPLAWSASELDRFDALLFDCDGVLWHETSPIPGAIETLQRLEDLGKKLLFATNNSGKSREAYMQKFGQLGFTVKLSPEQIFTSSQAAAHYLANLPDFDKTNQKVFTVGESGIGYELRAKGIECIEAMKLLGTTHMTKTELSKIEVDPTIGAVVVGIDEQLTYTKVAYATAVLNQVRDASGHRNDVLNRRCLFISTNQDSNLPTAGHTLPGAGSIVQMIATATGRTPVNMGKPETIMLDLACEQFGLDKSRVLMVGDRLDTDILFGRKGGVATLFVANTGIHTRRDIDTLNIQPTYVADDVNAMAPPKKE